MVIRYRRTRKGVWLEVGVLPPCVSFLGLCSKVPHTEWLTTADIYGLTVLEAASLSSSCQQGALPPKAVGKGRLQAAVLVAASALAYGDLPPTLTSRSPRVCICVWVRIFPFYKDTVIQDECLPYGAHLTWIAHQDSLSK